MSENNVVPLGRVVATNEPVQSVIEELEMLLERARAGEVRAIAYVVVDGGGASTTCWDIGTVKAAVLVGGIARLQYNACKAWEDAPKTHSPIAG
jgi:short subunit fatty acids transporter